MFLFMIKKHTKSNKIQEFRAQYPKTYTSYSNNMIEMFLFMIEKHTSLT
jgi:hypothetical protein